MGNETKQKLKLEKENKDAKKKTDDRIRLATDLDKTIEKMDQSQKAYPSER